VALAEELGVRGITTYSLPRGMTELSLPELASRSQEYEAGGFPQNARKFGSAYHMRFALPASTFVLSLLAFAIRGILRGRARRVVAIVFALGLYWATLALAERNTSLHPFVSVWAPNIVFAAISMALLRIPSATRSSSVQAQPFD
jgi:lipopolysaccharide export LptBFGC system permease protein LptF